MKTITKEVKHYVCEHCHTSYADSAKAENCEKGHKHFKCLYGENFVPLSVDKSGYPTKLIVLMDDDVRAVYRRMR